MEGWQPMIVKHSVALFTVVMLMGWNCEARAEGFPGCLFWLALQLYTVKSTDDS